MKWRRVVLAGCGGLLLLCLALPFIPYGWRVGQAAVARQRWEQNGAQNYTLIVSSHCLCPNTGDFKLTVRAGVVVAVEYVGSALFPPSGSALRPADFGLLTIDAMLARTEVAARRSWDVPWFEMLSIDYDPTYGYVTRYASEANGWLAFITGFMTDSSYVYSARDLQFIEP